MIYSLGDKKLNKDNLDFWVAPNAVIIGDVALKRNASVWFGAVLRGDNDPIILGENSNIQDLIDQLGFTNKRIAIEINEAIIPKSKHQSHPLKNHDRVEVINAVGGG